MSSGLQFYSWFWVGPGAEAEEVGARVDEVGVAAGFQRSCSISAD
jgi:hypothetical protein